MINRETIAAFVSEVARQFHPQRVVLSGSYASGWPNADSDVDLLVIMRHKGHAAVQAAEIRKRIRAGFPLDLLVRSPRRCGNGWPWTTSSLLRSSKKAKPSMKPSTREWVDKAEADFATAGRELRARIQPNYDAASFHAQQCAEKYLKGRLVQSGIRFPKTHDLDKLLDLCLPREPLWSVYRPMPVELSSYAIAYRYPGESATRELAKTAIANRRAVRQAIRASLNLPL
jgi:HEPN domain-containing protein/predicted nucleotidyltransferase